MSNKSQELANKAKKLSGKQIGDTLLNNALIIIMVLVAIYVAIKKPTFFKSVL